jgi:hypothetical protein
MVAAYQTTWFPNPENNNFVIEVRVLGYAEMFPLR